MKQYITTEEAVKNCNEQGALIPSAFLSVFPNNFGINLCAIAGFEVDMTDDGQYKTIRVDFLPVDKRTFEEENGISR
jgi:hypothetical protein